MSLGLKNVMQAAVVATAGFIATTAAAADNPAVEAIAVPTYSANAENSMVVAPTPAAPAFTVPTVA